MNRTHAKSVKEEGWGNSDTKVSITEKRLDKEQHAMWNYKNQPNS